MNPTMLSTLNTVSSCIDKHPSPSVLRTNRLPPPDDRTVPFQKSNNEEDEVETARSSESRSSNMMSMNLCLSDIKEYIAITLSSLLLDDDDDTATSRIHIHIDDIQEIPSAQQCVLIVTIQTTTKPTDHTNNTTHNTDNTHNTAKTKENISQQHSNHNHNTDSATITQALKDGNNRVVVRIWKGGASWWNLNSNCHQTCTQIAKAEVAGYKLARRAMALYNTHCQTKQGCSTTIQLEQDKWNPTQVIIPQLLYFSLDDTTTNTDVKKLELISSFPLAIFSYVGDGSNTIGQTYGYHPPNNTPTTNTNVRWVYCDSFAKNMIKTRYEFGYNEPHPRHGRVTVHLAIYYAMHLLDSVILPLHSAFFLVHLSSSTTTKPAASEEHTVVNNALLMEDSHPLSRIWNNNNNNNEDNRDTTKFTKSQPRPFQYRDMIALYQKTVISLKQAIPTGIQYAVITYNRKLLLLIKILEECVEHLVSEANLHYPSLLKGCCCCDVVDGTNSLPGLPPVLCHMDLQPQNMILRQSASSSSTTTVIHNKTTTTESCATTTTAADASSYIPQISSVLDWEESCYADPRFELLMLCRKVVANRAQADAVWDYYSKTMIQRFGLHNDAFGPIEPWLKLETVHSIFTLTTQAMNLQGGGRSPWEGKNDLWGKVSRELSRLVDLGWNFCQIEMIS